MCHLIHFYLNSKHQDFYSSLVLGNHWLKSVISPLDLILHQMSCDGRKSGKKEDPMNWEKLNKGRRRAEHFSPLNISSNIKHTHLSQCEILNRTYSIITVGSFKHKQCLRFDIKIYQDNTGIGTLCYDPFLQCLLFLFYLGNYSFVLLVLVFGILFPCVYICLYVAHFLSYFENYTGRKVWFYMTASLEYQQNCLTNQQWWLTSFSFSG